MCAQATTFTMMHLPRFLCFRVHDEQNTRTHNYFNARYGYLSRAWTHKRVAKSEWLRA